MNQNHLIRCSNCLAINGIYVPSRAYEVDGEFTYFRPTYSQGKWFFGLRRSNEKLLCRECGEEKVIIQGSEKKLYHPDDQGLLLAFSFHQLDQEVGIAFGKLKDSMTSVIRWLGGY